MSLLDRSVWWIVPLFPLALLMTHAMVQFTATLLVRPARSRRRPADVAELRRRLLALSTPGTPYRVVEGRDCDLELRWDVVDATWYELFARVKLSSVYRARMLLDEARREVRWHELLRTSSLFLGFRGWTPRFNWSFRLSAGSISGVWRGVAYGILAGWPPRIGQAYSFTLDTVRAKREVGAVIACSGWTFRPVVWWFEATRRGFGLLRALTPSPLHLVPPRVFWGVVYPWSFALTVGYVAAVAWPLDTEGLIVLTLFSGAWWAIWGGVAWLLARAPRSAGP